MASGVISERVGDAFSARDVEAEEAFHQDSRPESSAIQEELERARSFSDAIHRGQSGRGSQRAPSRSQHLSHPHCLLHPQTRAGSAHSHRRLGRIEELHVRGTGHAPRRARAVLRATGGTFSSPPANQRRHGVLSLAEAHDSGMVHRDIKPANIFLCRYGRDVDFVKILDFGIVKHDLGDSGLTQMGTFAGRPNAPPRRSPRA